jgi:hypothetical protein
MLVFLEFITNLIKIVKKYKISNSILKILVQKYSKKFINCFN